MTPYLISIILLFIACFVFDKTKWVAYLAIGYLFILSMFRAESVGLDTTAYIRMDDTYTPTGLRAFELIFLFVSTLKVQFGNSVVIYFFTIVTFISILLSCRRFKIKPTYAFFYFVLFLYFNLSLNIARQFAAASVLLYAYSFLNDKGRINLLYYFLLVLIACGIHISALIGFLIYPLKYFNVNKIKNTVLVAVIFVVYILISVIWSAYFVKWATSIYTDIYSTYFEEAEQINRILSWGNFMNIVMFLINVYIFTKLRYLPVKDKSQINVLSALFFGSILLTIFFETVYGNLGRIKYDISIINIIVYSIYFKNTKSKYKLVEIALVMLFFGYQYLYSLMNGSYGTVPYAFSF